jgi:hypothetical protein
MIDFREMGSEVGRWIEPNDLRTVKNLRISGAENF